jgi:hypothetical protein
MKLNAIILLLASTAPVAFAKALPVAGNNVAVTECVMKVLAGGDPSQVCPQLISLFLHQSFLPSITDITSL